MSGDAIRLELSRVSESARRGRGPHNSRRHISWIKELRDEEIARCKQRIRVMHRGRDLAARRATSRKKRCHRTWSKTLESLANPLESLRVRLQAALQSVTERASELGVLLVDYSKPGSAHDNQQMVPLLALNKQSIDVLVASY